MIQSKLYFEVLSTEVIFRPENPDWQPAPEVRWKVFKKTIKLDFVLQKKIVFDSLVNSWSDTILSRKGNRYCLN